MPTTAAAGPASMSRSSPYEEQYVGSVEYQTRLGVVDPCSWEAPLYHQPLPPPAYNDNSLVSRHGMFAVRCWVFTFLGSRQDSRRPEEYSSTSCQGPSPATGSIDATQVAASNAALPIDPRAPVPIAEDYRQHDAGNLFNRSGFLEHPGLLLVLLRNAAGWGWHSPGTSIDSQDL